MKIDTDEWLPVIEAGRILEMDKATALRVARRLGIVETFFGVNVIRRDALERMRAERRAVGNPRWIESGEAAAADSATGNATRRRPRS
jgi:hypothetical protein